MSDDNHNGGSEPPRIGVGYGNPPPEHQFKPGKSGNPRGRPVRPVTAATPRDFRNGILGVGLSPMTVRTPAGPKTVPAYEAVFLAILHRALSGHGPSARLFKNMYESAVKEHVSIHKSFGFLEYIETTDVDATYDTPVQSDSERFKNKIRRRTLRGILD